MRVISDKRAAEEAEYQRRSLVRALEKLTELEHEISKLGRTTFLATRFQLSESQPSESLNAVILQAVAQYSRLSETLQTLRLALLIERSRKC